MNNINTQRIVKITINGREKKTKLNYIRHACTSDTHTHTQTKLFHITTTVFEFTKEVAAEEEEEGKKAANKDFI